MHDRVRLIFLGTGTSHGVPVIGCDCAVCRSADPRNQRYRPSVLVEWRGKRLLVDTPPELRLQLLRAGVRQIDALLFTHTHADHLFGLDDVRVFNARSGAPLPLYAAPGALDHIQQQFFYVFQGGPVGGGKPQLDLVPISPLSAPFRAAGVTVQPVPVLHGTTPVLGFRFGDVAYITDTNQISDASLALLQDLDVLVLDALRWHSHPTHFSIAEALTVVERIRPRRVYFTHICHELDHDVTNRQLPQGVELAYDGLVLESPT